MTDHRRISGQRADLTGVRTPATLRRLLVEGRGIRSIEGIERMPALEEVTVERLPSPELRRLAALPALRLLTLVNLRGPVAWDELEQLTRLESLFIATRDRDDAEQVAAVDYGRLANLEVLRLNYDGGRVAIELDWLGRLTKLELFSLNGFVFEDRWLPTLLDAPRLEDVVITPASPAQYDRLVAAKPPQLNAGAFDVNVAPLGVVFEHETTRGVEFSVGLDLAGDWDVETNIEAECELVRLIRAQAPEVAERVRFDTESDAVWVLSDRRADIEAVQRIAAAHD